MQRRLQHRCVLSSSPTTSMLAKFVMLSRRNFVKHQKVSACTSVRLNAIIHSRIMSHPHPTIENHNHTRILKRGRLHSPLFIEQYSVQSDDPLLSSRSVSKGLGAFYYLPSPEIWVSPPVSYSIRKHHSSRRALSLTWDGSVQDDEWKNTNKLHENRLMTERIHWSSGYNGDVHLSIVGFQDNIKIWS